MLTIQEFIENRKISIDKLYIDEFWNSLSNSDESAGWIYLSDERINMIGFEGGKDRNRICYRLLESKFSTDTDYIIVTREHTIIHSTLKSNESKLGNRRKYYIVTIDCFKKLLLKANTKYSDKIYDYYIAVEKLFWQYTQYQNEFRLEQQRIELEQQKINAEKQVQETKGKIEEAIKQQQDTEAKLVEANKQLNRLGNYNQELIKYKLFTERNESLYIVTTKSYASQGLWKVGKTKNMSGRLASHNTSHPAGDEVFVAAEFKTGNSVHLEKRVEHILQHYRPIDNREFYRIPYNLLARVIEGLNNNLCAEEELINEITKTMAELISKQDEIDWTCGMPLMLTNDKNKCKEENLFIVSLKLTKEQAIDIVESILVHLHQDTIKIKELNELIKTKVKPKSAYRYKEWKQLIADISNNKGIKLKNK